MGDDRAPGPPGVIVTTSQIRPSIAHLTLFVLSPLHPHRSPVLLTRMASFAWPPGLAQVLPPPGEREWELEVQCL